MSGLTVALITAALIVLSAFFVVIEFALLGARRHRLETRASRSRSVRAALRGMNELTIMLAGAQLGITACTFALGAVTKPAVDRWLEPVFEMWGVPVWLAGTAAFALSLLFVTFLHLVIGEMAPKSWAIAHPELAATIIGVPSRAFISPFRPFLSWVNRIANTLVARTGVEPVENAAVGGRDADTIRHLVEYSTQVGVLEPELRSQITGVIELQALTVDRITVPASRATRVEAGATVAEVQDAALHSGHLRVLLTDGGGRSPAVVHVRDTLLADRSAQATEYARAALTVEQATPVYELLQQMREKGEQLAVVENSGQFIGIVTLADVVKRVLPGRRNSNGGSG